MNKYRFIILILIFVISGVLSCKADDVPLRSGDQLTIRLGGVPVEDINEVSGIYTLDGAGNINLPYIGKIKAGGLMQADVQSSIENGYKSAGIYTAPVVTVSVQLDRYVDVDGDVKAPQRVRYTPDMTLLSAISACGGLDDYANPTQVSILRNGTRTVMDIKKIHANKEKDLSLQPGDKVTVPRSFW
jgi:polysaccharide export outer membrane protein